MKMGYQLITILAAAASLAVISDGRTLVVGGSENWHHGFNYTDWAINNGPFFINDKLVFKYHNNAGYSVYLLPDLWSYMTCDFSRGKLLAGPTQGSGRAFAFELNQWRPLYFASGGKNDDGLNCNDGMMKFFVMPWPRWF